MASKMIQIRHVPEALHRRLRARAALAGMSLSDYLRQELEASSRRLTPNEVRERLALIEPAKASEPAADIIRRMRDAE